MQARTSTWTGSPEALDKWAEHVTRNVKPMVAGLASNAGAYFFIDRANKRALTLTLWSTDESARASDETADTSRARTVEATGVELLERASYEVVDSA
ncbi:MAG: hypothetical protein ABI562_04800 [Chloroflexota bacterium]